MIPADKTVAMKFGGASVGDAAAFAQVAGIVGEARREWQRVNVITSALSGVAGLLLESAAQAAAGKGRGICFRKKTIRNNSASWKDGVTLGC